ncbi:MAG: OadG family protein [Bacteroidales bacterium]|jgi:Na+-transporting methylmalonyl-CoA/oxaloacetate decarboxylase gamma subunit|nr:OadG family protein [Bacteroidales bacterium]
MKSIYKYIFTVVALFAVTATFGQSVHDLRLNEMMIKNVDNYADEYGRHVPWVEIFNTAYNTVNITGCYLTDDTTGLANASKKGGVIPAHWYRIPTDQKMYMPQRSFLIFYLDNSPLYGPYHANFTPAESETHYIALISANGKELLDIVEYPVELRDTARTYGYLQDGIRDPKAFKQGKRQDGELDYLGDFTPASSNETGEKISKQEKLKRDDPYGIGMAIISMAVVFTALIMIYIMLKIFNRVSRRATQKSKAKEEAANAKVAAVKAEDDKEVEGANAEEIAAIGVALHLHFGSMHDEESEVITINMPSKHYSPWAQKELTMKKNPRR